ncbi:hypothetical protein X777_03617 [Ooceraea biroi]|uniref:Uncharacterized protein n=1 Tax=Ooceraea biroi TaxID=2015173 RepID=A0A026WIR3_OOCBI|nr:hypothetical protein X777_03617 [Ooceraea biroi]
MDDSGSRNRIALFCGSSPYRYKCHCTTHQVFLPRIQAGQEDALSLPQCISLEVRYAPPGNSLPA